MTNEEITAELARVASCAGMHVIGRVGLQVAEKLAAEVRRLREENESLKAELDLAGEPALFTDNLQLPDAPGPA